MSSIVFQFLCTPAVWLPQHHQACSAHGWLSHNPRRFLNPAAQTTLAVFQQVPAADCFHLHRLSHGFWLYKQSSGCLSLALAHFTFQENRRTQGSAQVTCSSQIQILCHLPSITAEGLFLKCLMYVHYLVLMKYKIESSTQRKIHTICCKAVWANNIKIP